MILPRSSISNTTLFRSTTEGFCNVSAPSVDGVEGARGGRRYGIRGQDDLIGLYGFTFSGSKENNRINVIRVNPYKLHNSNLDCIPHCVLANLVMHCIAFLLGLDSSHSQATTLDLRHASAYRCDCPRRVDAPPLTSMCHKVERGDSSQRVRGAKLAIFV